MILKKSTLAGLDISIAELEKAITEVTDQKVKRKLEKTLKDFTKAREKLTPSKKFSYFYMVFAPLFLLFLLLGFYCFLRSYFKK